MAFPSTGSLPTNQAEKKNPLVEKEEKKRKKNLIDNFNKFVGFDFNSILFYFIRFFSFFHNEEKRVKL